MQRSLSVRFSRFRRPLHTGPISADVVLPPPPFRSPYRLRTAKAGCVSRRGCESRVWRRMIDTAECVGAAFLVRDDPSKNGRVVDLVQNAARPPHLRRTEILRGRSIFGRLDLSCENPTRYFHVYFLTRGGVVSFFFLDIRPT